MYTTINNNTRIRPLIILVLSILALGTALIGQYHYNLWPCSWCVFIRLCFSLIIVACIPLVIFTTTTFLRLIALGTSFIGTISGLAASVWMRWGPVTGTCNLSIADQVINLSRIDKLWPSVFGVFGMCGDLTPFFGLSFPMWGVVGFTVILILLFWDVWKTLHS